jgi:hypothetical protein
VLLFFRCTVLYLLIIITICLLDDDNIKTKHNDIGYEDIDWNNLAQERV